MPAASRKGDADNGGSSVRSSTASTVFINGKPAAIVGSTNSSHDDDHGPSSIVRGSGTVKIENKPAARKGDPYGCGHSLIEGSDNVTIGG